MTQLFHPLAAAFRLEGINGEAVILVHGFTGVPAHWRLLGPVVNEAGYTVAVPRLAGHGTSVDDLATTTAGDWVDTVRTEVRALGDHDNVHLVGLSMGGLISLVLAAELDAATVTTINSPMRYRDRMTYLAPIIHRCRPYIAWPEREDPALDPEAQRLWMTYEGFPTRQLGEVVRLARRARRAAARVVAPVLVIQSEKDESVDPTSAPIICRSVAGPCRIAWLKSSIHNALLDHERETIHRLVLGHVGTLPPSRGAGVPA